MPGPTVYQPQQLAGDRTPKGGGGQQNDEVAKQCPALPRQNRAQVKVEVDASIHPKHCPMNTESEQRQEKGSCATQREK